MGFDLSVGISAVTVFLQGLLSVFSPCVLPLIPLYIGYLAGGTAAVQPDGTIRYPRRRVLVNTPAALGGAVTPPPSKSQAHRLIIAAALSDGVCRLSNVELSQDIQATLRCMRTLDADASADGTIIRGADLVDGTPILDIKPYIPYADSHPEALGGFAAVPAGETLEVVIPPDLLEQVPEDHREALRGVLAQDPRPHYQKDPDRVYGMEFAGYEVKFTVSEKVLHVKSVEKCTV